MLNVTIDQFSYTSAPEVLILEDIAFSLEAGEHLVVLGESGCGKSTLLHLVYGLLHPRTWCFILEGQPASGAETQSSSWRRCYEISSTRI